MTDALDTEHRPLPDEAEVMTPYGLCTVKWVREHELSYWTEKLAYARANVVKYRRLLGLPDTDEEVREELVRAAEVAVATIPHLGGSERGTHSVVATLSAALAKAKVQP